MSTPPQSPFYLLKCAHCEGHFKIPGETPSSFFASCPSCGGGVSSSGPLVEDAVNTTVAATTPSGTSLPSSSPPSLPAATSPGFRSPGILPRDTVRSTSQGFQSPEFGGASFAAPASAHAAPTPVPPPSTNSGIVPDKRDSNIFVPQHSATPDPANSEYVKPDGWEIETSDEKPVSVSDPKTPRAVFFALTGIVLALCSWVTFKLISTSDELAEQNAAENRARREAIAAQEPKDPEAAARRARQMAGEAAYSFLHVQNLAGLKKYVREPDFVEDLLDRAYPDPSTFKPFTYKRIVPNEEIVISENGKFFTVDVVQSDDTIKPLTLERVERRMFLADWQSYVGYSGVPWSNLLIERPSDPVIVRARVTPGDFYGNDFENSKIYACFTLKDDLRQVSIYGYAPLRSSIATEALVFTEEEIENGTEKLVTLSISYPPKTRKTNQVNIEEFIHDAWFRE